MPLQDDNLNNRNIALSVTTNPPVLVSGGNADILLQFRLYDAKTNTTIKFPTLNIAITEGNDTKAKPLVQDLFQSASGLLTLQIHPQEGNVTVRGNREPFLNALQPDPGGTIFIQGPLFLHPGLYRVTVAVLGIDFPANIFADKDVKTFNTTISVARETTTTATNDRA